MTSVAPRLFQQPWPEGELRFFQLGFLVDDLLGVAERWTRAFGVGPFHVMPRSDASGSYRGADSTIDMQVAVAQAGPVQLELIQQFCDRPSVYRELCGRGASSFHQICTVTPDYDEKQAHYVGLGYELVSEFDAGSARVAFFDTLADFGFFTEVFEQSAPVLGQLSAIAQTCAEWDGATDPIRLLTRDGYRTP